ncbi:MAG: HTH domain-containing protein [Candidatus Nanoarchaeia archaeon]
MEKEEIKSAFLRVKQDITGLKSDITELKDLVLNLYQEIDSLKLVKTSEIPLLPSSTLIKTDSSINPTLSNTPTHNPTLPQEIGGLKSQYLDISTGNEGVPTDRQTHQQTNQQMRNTPISDIEDHIRSAGLILESLDSIRKEIRLKFKHITSQEMTVFSTIYQLEEADSPTVTYNKIAKILHLSPSSIRDYVQRIISKGIPINKEKINNKQVVLSIPKDLKKIASLSTIISLREL